ncbi:MAG TPA: phosphotransferase [Puia sp.]|nr:phosphotransferase [Puia sp.]
MVSLEKQPEVKKALLTTFGVDNFENIKQLTKGLSGALVFKVMVHQRPYVLRIITRAETRDKPSYYFDCLRTAATAGLAPAVHYLNVEDRISITDFIETEYFPIRDARIKMISAIKTLHNLPKFVHRLDFVDASDTFLRRFRESKMVPGNAMNHIFELYHRIANVYPRSDRANLVSSHNDVKPDNIIYDGSRPWLVDWEAARLNDRYVDLASIANFLVGDESNEMEILARYFGKTPNEYQRARFFLMRQIVHMFCFTLCTIVAAAGKSIDMSRKIEGFNEFHEHLWHCRIDLADNDAGWCIFANWRKTCCLIASRNHFV